jgi:hypothetical protein
MEPLRLPEILEGLEGLWVAIKDGRAVESAKTPEKLVENLRRRNLQGATILRVPERGEPELVGLG